MHTFFADSKLKNLYVRVGNKDADASTLDQNGKCKDSAVNAGSEQTLPVTCIRDLVGRFVYIHLDNTDDRVLALCEVKVTGHRFIGTSIYIHATRNKTPCY